MNTKILLAAAAAMALGFASQGAQAATFFTLAGPTAEAPTDTSLSETFNATAGAATASFIIDGYASLDGQNSYEDDFSLSLNGVAILTGTFNLGGGGLNVIYSNPNGGTAVNTSGNGTNITFAGGHVDVTEPLALLAGSNTLTFAYTSLSGAGYAGFQGTGDEGWGIEQVSVASAVPEPATWAMMLVGFGAFGVALRARRGRVAFAA